MFNPASNSGKRKIDEAAAGSEQLPSTAANQFNPINPSGIHQFASLSTFLPPIPRYQFGTPSNVPPPQQIMNMAAPTVRPISFKNLLMAEEARNHPAVTETRSQIEEIFKFHSESLRDSVNGILEMQRESLHRAADEHAAKKLKRKEAEFQFMLARKEYLEGEAERWKEEGERLAAEMRNLEEEARSITMSVDRVYAERRRRNAVDTVEESACSTMLGDVGNVGLKCNSCETHVATVMMLPCRHVSACVGCNDVIQTCPVCWKPKKNSVQIEFSRGD